MNAGFSRGNTQIIIPKFSPEAVFDAIQNKGGTVFCGVPTMYWHMLTFENNGKYDFDKIAEILRLGVSGGASLPLEIIKGVEKKFNIPIVEGFGLSETSPVVTFNHLNRVRKPGSIGTPIWGVEAMVVDENDRKLPPEEVGELVVRGHNVMKGYYNKPDETAAAFKGATWFHTGDLAKTDNDGYFYIVDRVKDMIIRGGYNVYPREIEEVMMSHPAISMAAVIGVPHDQHGEEIKAFLILNEGQSVSEEDIVSWSKEQMAAYKYPRVVEICESLPITATGKILKKELRQ
jgi:long-chain acyl-CoA synthetase